MATGRADFWYGRPFIVVDVPVDGDSEDAPTANWAYNHAANPSAHHVRYGDAEAVLAMGSIGNLNPLNHNRYSNGEAKDAMGLLADYNPMNHTRYADSEAVTAMGTKADANPLNHNRYTDANAQAACLPAFVFRGSVSAWDKEGAGFVQDGAWHEWDLSAIVPDGAKAVMMRVALIDDTPGIQLAFRPAGETGANVRTKFYVQTAGVSYDTVAPVIVTSARKVDYLAINTTWDMIAAVVLGWWK